MLDELDTASPLVARQDLMNQALFGVVRSLAESTDADAAMLLAEPPGREDPVLLAAWHRAEPQIPVPRAGDGLLARALDADGAVVEPGRAIASANGEAALRVARLAAPVRPDRVRPEGEVQGTLYAFFATPSGRDPEELCDLAESYAYVAALAWEKIGS